MSSIYYPPLLDLIKLLMLRIVIYILGDSHPPLDHHTLPYNIKISGSALDSNFCHRLDMVNSKSFVRRVLL